VPSSPSLTPAPSISQFWPRPSEVRTFPFTSHTFTKEAALLGQLHRQLGNGPRTRFISHPLPVAFRSPAHRRCSGLLRKHLLLASAVSIQVF